MAEGIALIPARGGSQRIPRKNIRDFHGIPALTRVVHTILDGGVVQRIVVSTDDPEIAEVARAAGAEVPFMRPAELADNFTGARPVIQHALEALHIGGSVRVGVFYPTAVLITRQDVEDSAALLESDDCEFVLSVAEFPAPVERALTLGEDGVVSPHDPGHILTRSQDLSTAYHDLGQFYWGMSASWLTDVPVVQARCRAYVVEAWRAVDIDTPADWERAEMVYRMRHGGR